MSEASLQDRAKQLLDRNAKRGRGYFYTAPSRAKYPHQWSWDSSFHAIANCHLGRVNLAIEEILTLLSKMLPDGHLPHMIYHGRSLTALSNRILFRNWPAPDRSPFVQPPVAALAAKEIWQQSEDKGFIREALPRLEKHFEWLSSQRRFGCSKLVSIFSPWESGLDHKPGFDALLGDLIRLPFGRYLALYTLAIKLARRKFLPREIHRRGYFNVREVLFNTIYALGLEALAVLNSAIGNTAAAERYQQMARDVEDAILGECYDAETGLYFDIDANTGRFIREPSISSLMPFALGSIPEERCSELMGHLEDKREFWLRFPVPSVPSSSPHFDPDSLYYLWRGPTWINTNWFIVKGLIRHGYGELAETIAEKSRELVKKSGFREYYNPVTGAGGGQRDFAWSTLAAVM